MKAKLILVLNLLIFINQVTAQRNCSTFTYQQQQLKNDPSLFERINAIEAFTRQQNRTTNNSLLRTQGDIVIKIPVVVHILYHQPSENITDEQVYSQIEALNRDYRR